MSFGRSVKRAVLTSLNLITPKFAGDKLPLNSKLEPGSCSSDTARERAYNLMFMHTEKKFPIRRGNEIIIYIITSSNYNAIFKHYHLIM